MADQDVAVTPDGLTAEVTRWYVEESGRPRAVVSNFYLCDPEEHPEAVQLPGTEEGSWWLPSLPVETGRRWVSREEYLDAAAEYETRLAKEAAEREAAREAEAARLAEERRAARERARRELLGLGLSEETVETLFRGIFPEEYEGARDD